MTEECVSHVTCDKGVCLFALCQIDHRQFVYIRIFSQHSMCACIWLSFDFYPILIFADKLTSLWGLNTLTVYEIYFRSYF